MNSEQKDREMRLVCMLKICIAELRANDAHTIPLQAENLLKEFGYTTQQGRNQLD